MKILLLGGTGAMGSPMVSKLECDKTNRIFVTSRSRSGQDGNVTYIQGNAHDYGFLTEILKKHYDIIVDFMIYRLEEFKLRLSLFLNSTGQYVFISSSRVYADSETMITETSHRLIDVLQDKDYLATDEYALVKAREENCIFESGKTNWTIIRPYISYGRNKFQLGVYEKENWLFRAIHGRSVVFPNDIAEKKTALTYGVDVANAVCKLIGNERALGEVFHVVTSEFMTWQRVLDVYKEVIYSKTGSEMRVIQPSTSLGLQEIWYSPAQIKYDRLYNRSFDNSKIISVIGELEFVGLKDGIEESLMAFLTKPSWGGFNWHVEAWEDQIARERTPIGEIMGTRAKIKYIKARYLP